jgi:hypothetical protein
MSVWTSESGSVCAWTATALFCLQPLPRLVRWQIGCTMAVANISCASLDKSYRAAILPASKETPEVPHTATEVTHSVLLLDAGSDLVTYLGFCFDAAFITQY